MNYHIEGCYVRFSHYRPYSSQVDDMVRYYKHFPDTPLRRVVIRDYIDGCATEHYVRGFTKWTPSVWGGTTICSIHDAKTNEVISMSCTDCKYPDHFCYKTGRDTAFQNALKNAVRRLRDGNYEEAV